MAAVCLFLAYADPEASDAQLSLMSPQVISGVRVLAQMISCRPLSIAPRRWIRTGGISRPS